MLMAFHNLVQIRNIIQAYTGICSYVAHILIIELAVSFHRVSVSYTHLDVYKRQDLFRAAVQKV